MSTEMPVAGDARQRPGSQPPRAESRPDGLQHRLESVMPTDGCLGKPAGQTVLVEHAGEPLTKT